jgi:hypothetical protein
MYLFNDMLEARQKRAFGLGDLSDGSIIVRTVARISFGSGWGNRHILQFSRHIPKFSCPRRKLISSVARSSGVKEDPGTKTNIGLPGSTK